MMKRNIALIALAAVSICAASVFAQPGGGPPMMGPPHRMGGGPGMLIPLLLRSTDLTADQDSQVHQIVDADRPAVQEIFGQLRQAHKDLASLLLGPQAPQSDAVTAQLAQIAGLQQQVAQHQVAAVTAIRAVLTPDQLAKALAAKDQMPPHHGHKGRWAPDGN